MVDAAPVAVAPAPAVAPVQPALDGSRAQNASQQPEPAKPGANKAEPGKAAETPKTPYKRFELDLNGKKVERIYNSDEEIQRDIQKVLGLEEKMSTHAQKVEATEQLLEILQSDDPNAYKKFEKQCKAVGIDPEKFATNILYNKIELEKLTPEQRELREYKEREAEQKAEQAAKDAEAEKVKLSEEDKIKQQKAAEWAKEFEGKCSEALKAKKLPAAKLSLALVAQYMQAGLAQKKEYTLDQIIPYVQRDLQHLQKQTYENLDGQALLDYLGPELIEKITTAKVARYKSPGNGAPVPDKKPVAKVGTKTIKQLLREKPLDTDFGDQY